MTRQLTAASTLDNLKKEAKRWLKALRANDEQACARLIGAYPNAPEEPGLRDIQHALALEHGLAGWTALKARLADAAGDPSREAAVTALLDAAHRGDAPRVAELLDTHPDIINERGHLTGHSGLRTALHFAINSKDEAVIGHLLGRGADPNIRDEGDNAMPLHFAAEKEHLGIIRLLIEHGADPIGAGDGHELEVIGWATCFGKGRKDIVDYLIAHGAVHNIFSAVAMGEVEIIRTLAAQSRANLDRPMDSTNKRRRPLHLAVVKKQPQSLAALLELGADTEAVDEAGMTPLDQAALAGEPEMAELLIEHGATLHLPAAIGLQKTADIERLVNEDPDGLKPGHRWGTLIVRASEHAPGHVIEALIRLGASVDVSDDPRTAVDGTTGYTPLHGAAFRGNAEVVSILLEHGANPSALDGKYGGTPAGWAEYAGYPDVRDLILAAAAADPRHAELVESFLKNACLDWRIGGFARISAGHTADRLLRGHPDIARDSLYTAVVCGDLAGVERRLAERPDAASEKGGPREWPALLYLCSTRLSHSATNDNAVAIARALLDHGADPNAWYPGGSDSIHYTALTCVFGEGEENAPRHPQFEALTQLLFERGAEPYDMQVLYNTHFHGNILWLLEQMYLQAVRLGRRADWDDPNWSMLDMGGYGCGARYLLGIAVEKNNLELAEWILAHGASPNPPAAEDPRLSKRTLLEEAVRRGHQEMADLLVRHGAPRSALVPEGEEAFAAACFRLDRDEARTLLAQHPEYLRSTVAMLAAAQRDRADVVAFLLDLGMSVNVQDANGARALHAAAYADAPGVVALLLERGAEVDPRDSNHANTPLGWAVYGRRQRTIDLLVRVSRDVFELTWLGAVERVRDVLSTEPDLARIVRDGHTLLMWLPDDDARAMEIAKLLLSHGADPSIRTKEGETAEDRARNRGLEEVAELLQASGLGPQASGGGPQASGSGPRASGLALQASGLGPLDLYDIDASRNRIRLRAPLSEKDWDRIITVMKERQIAGVDATGQMTDALLGRISQLDHVTRLDLDGSNRITDAGLLHLARMPQLQDLNVSGWKGQITDRGLEVLRHLPALTRFQMCWQQGVSDAGAAHLTSCDHLESVDLLGTPTGDGAINALTAKRRLRRFKSGKLVTDAGLPLLHQFPVFKTWQGGDIHYSLMSPDAQPNHLLLDGPFTNKGLAGLAGLDGLFALSVFWHISALTPDGLEPLAQFPNLGFLGCQGKLCNDEAMRHIGAIPRLRMLMAQGTVSSDEGFAALSRSHTLEYIWGRECPNLTGLGFAALAAMPALRGLAVSCKHVDDTALSSLPRFPALKELMPMDVTDEGFRHVGRCEQLESLWCMYCRDTGDAATEHIAGLSNLKSYYAGQTRITDRSLEILGRMPSLERLEFWNCAAITDAGVAHLAGLPRLREVHLSGVHKVTLEGAAVFPARIRVDYSA